MAGNTRQGQYVGTLAAGNNMKPQTIPKGLYALATAISATLFNKRFN